jgi:hypothetical protein
MQASTIELYKHIKSFYAEMLPKIDGVSRQINEAKTNRKLEDFVDIAYAMREIAAFADELRKQAARVQDISEKVACLIWVEDSEKDLGSGVDTVIRTDYATGTPQIQFMGRIPDKKKNPEEFRKLMEFFEVPALLYEGEGSSAVKFHWPGLIDTISNLLAEGKPVPPGIDGENLFPVYSMHIRKRKAIDES